MPAAESVGVDGGIACNWVARGEGRDKRPKRKVFEEFAKAIRKAQAENVMRRIGRMEVAAKGGTVIAKRTITKPTRQVDASGNPVMTTITEEKYQEPQWTVDGWFLERYDPERWGRRIIEHTGPQGGPMEFTFLIQRAIPSNGHGELDVSPQLAITAGGNGGNGHGGNGDG
jgi:hypothetical protein